MNKISLSSAARFSILFMTLLLASLAQATDRYVSDVMHIQLRKGPSNQQEIVASGLASGTHLTFIREELDSSRVAWSLVKTADGTQGWVRSQFLVREPTAAVVLPQLQQAYNEALRELDQLRQSNVRAIEIEKENQRLHENYQLLQTRADVLQAENDHLKNTDRYNQWVYGGGLLLCGVILSFILQAFGKRKRQSDWR